MNSKDKKEVKKEYVIISIGEVDIIIAKDDEWYPALSKDYPNERPFDLDEMGDHSDVIPSIEENMNK